MVVWNLPAEVVPWIALLSQPLHGRLAWRLLPLLRGLLFAQGRRTVAAWLRAAGLGQDFQRYYYFLGSLGRKVDFVASLLLRRVAGVVAPGERILFGLDDTPTKRYGPHVEGAGIHHNPSPGPGRPEVPLRPRLGDHRLARPRIPPGAPSACPCGPALRPPEGRRRAAPGTGSPFPHQAGDGRRPAW